jgi:protein TIF31
LPAGHVAAGLPETPSPLKVAVTPSESLNELRITITDSPEGYWLGAFCFRRPSSHTSQANGTGKKRLGEKVNEWTELKEIFKDVPRDERALHVAHGKSLLALIF